MWNTAFRCLTIDVSLGTDDPALVGPLRALTASYALPGFGATLRYWLETRPLPRLLRDSNEVIRAESATDLVPLFELDLYHELITYAARGCLLHAACLAVDDRALILVGPSGAGKSTLALSLLGRGSRYLSDEYTLLTDAGMVKAHPADHLQLLSARPAPSVLDGDRTLPRHRRWADHRHARSSSSAPARAWLLRLPSTRVDPPRCRLAGGGTAAAPRRGAGTALASRPKPHSHCI